MTDVRESSSDPLGISRPELEQRLVGMWQNVLGVDRIDTGDDFFSLGGDWRHMRLLFHEIESDLGLKPPPASLFQTPTIAQQAVLLAERAWPDSWDCLIPIQTGGANAPLFFIHGFSGEVLHVKILAQMFGKEQPFYALQAVGVDGVTPPLRTIEAMASRYMSEIEKVQRHGPYVLGAFCVGSLVALEMARRWREKGEEVALLALIGPVRPRLTRAGPCMRFHRMVGRGKRFLISLRRSDTVRFDGVAMRVPEVKQANRIAVKKYRPQEYPGRILLFVSTHYGPWRFRDRERLRSWLELAGGECEHHVIPGTHDELFRGVRIVRVVMRIRAALKTLDEIGTHGS